MALCNIPSFQSLDLASNHLGSAELAELAPALYDNTYIKVLDMSENHLNDMAFSQQQDHDHPFDLSVNKFGQTTSAIDCIIGEGL
jgi:hypothetical protein